MPTLDTNIRGTWMLLEACRRTPNVKQILVASSDKAYGDQAALPYTEESPVNGRHPYDVSKGCADLVAQMFAKSYELPVCVTRCGNFYGGGDLNWNRIVPGTIRSIVQGERPVVRSDGLFTRDYLYVEDGASAYLRLLAEQMAARPGFAAGLQFFLRVAPDRVWSWSENPGVMGSTLEADVRNEVRTRFDQALDASKARRCWAGARSSRSTQASAPPPTSMRSTLHG